MISKIMIGRPKKKFKQILRPISIISNDGTDFYVLDILIECPVCGSDKITTNGTQKRKEGYVETFMCKNNQCSHLKTSKFGKQFTKCTSSRFIKLLDGILKDILFDLMLKNTSMVFIAEKYGVSTPTISMIANKLENTVDRSKSLSKLVPELQDDSAIAIDETFLKIGRKTAYIIIATGYNTGNILGIRVSETRKEGDMRIVFDEADRNTVKPIEIVTADAWGATQAMIKNLMRPVTLVIHKHKKPYDRAVIRRIEYDKMERIITEIGVKTDFFKKRGKREYYWRKYRESLIIKPKGKRGRPKGVKNGRGKKLKKKRHKKKRGRKGVFAVFLTGRRKYAYIDPYRLCIKIGGQPIDAIQIALEQCMTLFYKMFVQNNVAEGINSLLRLHFRFSGPKTFEGIEKRLRTYAIFRNAPYLLNNTKLDYSPRSGFFNAHTSIGHLPVLLKKV